MSKKPKTQSKPKPSRVAREEAGGKVHDGFTLPPRSCYIIGVDTKDGPKHPLYEQSAVDLAEGRAEWDMRMLRSLHTFGVKQPIIVRFHTVPDDDQAWPADLRGRTVHVVVAGRRRVLHGRRVVEEKFAAGEIGHQDNWQIKCSLELARSDRDLVSIMADENVCRRVLTDAEIAEGILKGISVSLTIDEMAERYGLTVAKAKRLLARAQGIPERPRKEPLPRVPVVAINRAMHELRERGANREMDNSDIADLLDCIRGKMQISDASHYVRALLGLENT